MLWCGLVIVVGMVVVLLGGVMWWKYSCFVVDLVVSVFDGVVVVDNLVSIEVLFEVDLLIIVLVVVVYVVSDVVMFVDLDLVVVCDVDLYVWFVVGGLVLVDEL